MSDHRTLNASHTPEGRTPWASLPGVLALVTAYALVHMTVRLLASENLGEDDPLDNLLVQSLMAGYSPTQPPLYDWLLWLLQQLLDLGVQSFLVLKYTLLVTLAGLLFVIGQRLTGSALWGLLTVDAMALTYQIFWRFHEGFTHRVGAITLAAATLWALIRLIDRPQTSRYLFFGMAAGLGLLSELNYVPLLAALVAAAWMQPGSRLIMRSPKMLLAVGIAAFILLPYAAWLLAEPQRTSEFIQTLFPAPLTTSLGKTLRDAATFPLLVLAPFVFILPLFFPGIGRAILSSNPRPQDTQRGVDLSRLILHTLLIEWLWLLVEAGWRRHIDPAVHALLPMFIIALPWLLAKAHQSAPSKIRIRAFVAFSLLLTVVALSGRIANMFVLDPVCHICRWGTPYAGLAEHIKASGFTRGIILSPSTEIAGNLRRFFPDACLAAPGALPVNFPHDTPVLLVWEGHDSPSTAVALLPAEMRRRVKSLQVQPKRLHVPWTHLWRPQGYRHSDWNIQIVPPSATLNTPGIVK